MPLIGIDTKRRIPFILTRPSESPDKKFASIRTGSWVLTSANAAIPNYPDFWLLAPFPESNVSFALGAFC